MKSVASTFIVVSITSGILFLNLPISAQSPRSPVSDKPSVPEERGIAALDQSLRELSNPFTVMAIAARPEDADYATLAYCRKKLGARTVLVFLTRGENSNSLTAPPGVNSVVINTERALEVAQLIGSDVYFLNLSDLDYKKSADGVLGQWGHDNALGRLVRAVRLLRPDVMIACHRLETGNAQQWAAHRLALEAFDAAVDPERFKEADTVAWRASRLFQPNDQPIAQVIINTGEYDYLRGLTYEQMGVRASELVTGTARPDNAASKRQYKLLRSLPDDKFRPGSGLLDGLLLPEKLRRPLTPPFIGDLPAHEAINQRERLKEALREKLTEKRAEGSIEQIRERYGEQFFRVIRYAEALERSLALAYGLTFTIETSDSILAQGQQLKARLVISNGSEQRLSVAFHTPEAFPPAGKPAAYKLSAPLDLLPGETTSFESIYDIPKDAPVTLPHRDHPDEASYYPIGSALPGARAGGVFGKRLIALAEVLLSDTHIFLPAQIRFDIVSPVEIETFPFVVIKDWEQSREIEIPVRLRNRLPGESAGALWVVPLALRKDDYEPAHVTFSREDEEVEVRLRLTLPILKPPLTPDLLLEFRREKPASPTPLASAKIEVVAFDFDVVEGLKVGVVGDDERVVSALLRLGAEPYLLPLNAVRKLDHGNLQPDNQSPSICGDLAKYDSIIVVENTDVIALRDCLLYYVRRGGNLIVFNQRADRWNAGSPIAPFAIKLSGARIAEGDSFVRILDENHPLMVKPNRVTPIGFSDWKQIIASSLAVEWANEYTPLVELNGAGESSQSGALMAARVGDGTYIYSSLELGRQLSRVSPGAYRLFANLISFGKVTKEQTSR